MVAVWSVQYDDLTYDEQDHLNYGIAIWRGHTEREVPGRDFNTTMPVTAWNALPRVIEQLLHPGLHKTDGGLSDARAGRYMSIAFTLLLLIYGYAFASTLAGRLGGCLAMLLLAADPNILAHSRLVTTDVYATTAFLAVLYHLYRWRIEGNSRHFYFWCLAIALAVCCKINNVLLYPLCLLVLLITSKAYRSRTNPQMNPFWRSATVFVVIQLLVINTCFLWNGFGFAISEVNFRSHFFTAWQHSGWSAVRLPLPLPFVQSFDLAQYERETFAGTALNYLAGELRYRQGFWNYYLVCWTLKTPILTQLAAMFALSQWIIRRWRVTVAFWVLPALALGLLLSTSSVQSGYRYLLPITALSLVFTGAALAACLPLKRQWLYPAVLVMAALPMLTGFPNFIAYTNLLVWNKTMAYRWLADSNLNWGQRDAQVKEYVRHHPEIQLDPDQPTTGKILVDINRLTGTVETGKYDWLRRNYVPMGTFEKCYLLFDVKSLPDP